MIKRAWCADTGHDAADPHRADRDRHTRRGPLPGPQAGRRATPPPPRDTQHRGLGRRGKAHHDRRCEGEKDASNSGFSGFACPQRGRGEILTFPDTPTTQGLSLWCFNTVGGEILTFPDTPTTQGLSLWSYGVSTQWPQPAGRSRCRILCTHVLRSSCTQKFPPVWTTCGLTRCPVTMPGSTGCTLRDYLLAWA